MEETYNFYGITNNEGSFEKELLFTCKKDERDEAKQLMPSITKDYLFIFSEYTFCVYPFGSKSLTGRIYHNYEILNLDLKIKHLILNGYRITPHISHWWAGKMDDKYVEYKLEDTRNGKEIILTMSYGGIDKVLDGLRLINTYGLTPNVMERLNDFQ